MGRIRHLPFEVVAAKPLVESASATALMDAAGAVKAVWMLRHYPEVARSNVSRFGMDNPCPGVDDSFPGRAGLAIQRYDRGNVGDGHRRAEPTAYTIRRGRASSGGLATSSISTSASGRTTRIRILRYNRACNKPDEVIRFSFPTTSDWRCPSAR